MIAKPVYLSVIPLILLSVDIGQAQQDVALQHIDRGRAQLAAGDTSAALSEFRKAAEAAPDLADAHFYIGHVLARRASSVETDFRDRQAAEKALRKAISLDHDNPSYLAELGYLHIKQHMRTDAERVLKLALKNAKEQGYDDEAMLADLYFNIGSSLELMYEDQRDRRMNPMLRGAPPTTTVSVPAMGNVISVNPSPSPWLYRNVQDYLDEAPPIDIGSDTRDRMVESYRAALKHDPNHFEASRRLLLNLLEEDRLAEYIRIADGLVQAYPDRAEPYLYLGLGLHTAGKEDAAGAAFDMGLAKLPAGERIPYVSLDQVMREKSAEKYLEMDDDRRASFEQLYWRLSDPLYLTEANERRLEHLSRVAYADLRFSEPETGERGWETPRGVVFIRYGPAQVSVIRSGASVTRIWLYEAGLVFMFAGPAGYYHAKFAGDYHNVAKEFRETQPAAYTNIASIAALLPMPVQIARFRGNRIDEVAVEVHAELPLEGLTAGLDMKSVELQTGFFLLNRRGAQVVRQVKPEVIEYGGAPSTNALRSWRLMLPASDRLTVSVEAKDELSWRASAVRDTFTARLFHDDSVNISDILLGDAIRPLAAQPLTRKDFDIQPNAAREFVPNQPVHIYYELYGFERDAENFANYDVSLSVRIARLTRKGTIAQFLGTLADAWGFSVVGDDRLELRFSREVNVSGRDRVSEFLSLDLEEAPAGDYEINLQVWDRVGERLARRSRTFSVLSVD